MLAVILILTMTTVAIIDFEAFSSGLRSANHMLEPIPVVKRSSAGWLPACERKVRHPPDRNPPLGFNSVRTFTTCTRLPGLKLRAFHPTRHGDCRWNTQSCLIECAVSTLHSQGVLAGSVTTFFGFIGFDEVCCMAGEAWRAHRNFFRDFGWQATNPRKTVPRALIGTLLCATVLPLAASLALVGHVLRGIPHRVAQSGCSCPRLHTIHQH